jgi:glycine/D-amino acid oxidase-like deaminating enzyme
MRKTADVVVIGGGSWGASSAYHLAKAGAEVILVDQYAVNSQNSPRAAGMVMQTRETDVMTLLARRSVEHLEELSAAHGDEIGFSQAGSLKVARDEQSMSILEDQFARAKRLAVSVEMLSSAQAHARAPYAEFDGSLAIMYTPTDVNLDAAALTALLLDLAADDGATICPNTPVLGIQTDGGRITGVETGSGTIATPVVVNAAGAWSPTVAAMVGLQLPVVPARHQLYVTDPLPVVSNEQPGIHILDALAYVRPDRGGLLFGGYETEPLMVPSAGIEEHFEMSSLELDGSVIDGLWELVARQLPILENATIRERRGGLPTLTPDGHFVIDGDVGVEGFFVATGCCVSGLARSPAVGEVIADLVMRRDPFTDISALRLDRFARSWSAEELVAACRHAYAHRY